MEHYDVIVLHYYGIREHCDGQRILSWHNRTLLRTLQLGAVKIHPCDIINNIVVAK